MLGVCRLGLLVGLVLDCRMGLVLLGLRIVSLGWLFCFGRSFLLLLWLVVVGF